MHDQIHWLEYGNPTDDDRLEATYIIEYVDNRRDGHREDDVYRGTLDMSVLELWESDPIKQAEHNDFALELSILDNEHVERLLETWESDEGDDTPPHAPDREEATDA